MADLKAAGVLHPQGHRTDLDALALNRWRFPGHVGVQALQLRLVRQADQDGVGRFRQGDTAGVDRQAAYHVAIGQRRDGLVVEVIQAGDCFDWRCAAPRTRGQGPCLAERLLDVDGDRGRAIDHPDGSPPTRTADDVAHHATGENGSVCRHHDVVADDPGQGGSRARGIEHLEDDLAGDRPRRQGRNAGDNPTAQVHHERGPAATDIRDEGCRIAGSAIDDIDPNDARGAGYGCRREVGRGVGERILQRAIEEPCLGQIRREAVFRNGVHVAGLQALLHVDVLAVQDPLDDEIDGVLVALGDRRHRAELAGRVVVGPGIDVLLLEEGKRQQHAVVAHAPDQLERFLGVGPLEDLVAEEQVVGQDRDVGARVDVHVQVIGQVPHDRALGLHVEDVVVDHDGRHVGAAVVGLWCSNSRSGRNGSKAAAYLPRGINFPCAGP